MIHIINKILTIYSYRHECDGRSRQHQKVELGHLISQRFSTTYYRVLVHDICNIKKIYTEIVT